MKNQQLSLLLVGVFASLVQASDNATDTNSTSSGLSGGAVAGIIIGTIAGVALIGALVWYLFFKEGAMYASAVGRGVSTAASAASISSSAGKNHLPMVALRVSADEEL